MHISLVHNLCKIAHRFNITIPICEVLSDLKNTNIRGKHVFT
jgi:hypothetical protein